MISPKYCKGTEERLPIDRNSDVLNYQAPANKEIDVKEVNFISPFFDQPAYHDEEISKDSEKKNAAYAKVSAPMRQIVRCIPNIPRVSGDGIVDELLKL